MQMISEKKGLEIMKIKLIIPNKTILEQEANKISAPGSQGSFQILPKHIDITSSLDSGILSITDDNSTQYYAIHKGVLVKQADMVYISCFQAIKGNSLEELNEAVINNFNDLSEREKKAREVLIRLEADTIRRFMEVG